MPRKWPTASLKQQAYVLRQKEHLTDEQIYARFIADGKMVQPHIPAGAGALVKKINTDVLNHPSASPPVTQGGVSLPPDLLKIVQYTALAQQSCESWRPADTIAFLEKSKQLQQTTQEADQLAKATSTESLLALIKPEKSLPNGLLASTSSSVPSNSPTSPATDK